jgi:transcriptional regulator with XRE-family HTH domain
MKTLGQRIRELRDAKDLSLREFAKQVGGLSAAFLSDVELGRRHPSETVLSAMAKALGTTVTDLKKYDSRAPINDLKRLSSADPVYGFAFRQIVDKGVSAEELLKFLDRQPGRKKK